MHIHLYLYSISLCNVKWVFSKFEITLNGTVALLIKKPSLKIKT